MTLKSDIINNAFKHLKISGITVNPTSGENDDALYALESMAEEIRLRCLNYYFEDTPDLNTPHNLHRKYWFSVEIMLAYRLTLMFGKEPTTRLTQSANAAASYLSGETAQVRSIQYPSRMPLGKGNRLGTIDKYFTKSDRVPLSCETVKMYVGDIEDRIESFNDYLRLGEDIDSYTIDADTGLTISGDANATPDITYTVTATGTGETLSNAVFRVEIVITTTDSRQLTKIINYELTSPPDIE